MTFERLVRDERFASEVTTTVAGRLELPRPTRVVIADANVDSEQTAILLQAAHARAERDGAATLIHALSVPFVGFEDTAATDVKPDFAVVAASASGSGSWLVIGDAKDYERMRSRIDDTRLLKGFLQVAVGAESCAAWSRLPVDMVVHRFGALAVPRNAFLQPEVIIEDLHDHRSEVRLRVGERRAEAAQLLFDSEEPIEEFVAHLQARFNPLSCATCTLFGYCRDELRRSADPADLLIELGVLPELRPQLVGLVDGTGEVDAAPASAVALVTASLTGAGQSTRQRRIDPAGQAGTVNVVVAKSDSSALGLHGIAVQRVTAAGRGSWGLVVFEDPQSQATRRDVMRVVGAALTHAMAEMRKVNPEQPAPVHLVVPDRATADVLVSIADNLAGIELSRLRWLRDKEQGRPALTFNGEEAVIPNPLREPARTAVSFLLEEDRARVLRVRSPIVDVGAALRRHVVAGGPEVNSFRLDYLVEWADPSAHVEHRALSDDVEASEHTPGARLANAMSDRIHQALVGTSTREDRAHAAEPEVYRELVNDELAYKCGTFEHALDALALIPHSSLRDAYRAIEGDAQAVWRRRLELRASDLVRFGRTYRWWRNSQVEAVESDAVCQGHLLALTNGQWARDRALAAGVRQVAFTTVVSADPLVLDVESRTLGEGSRVVLLHTNERPSVEEPSVEVKSQKGSFRIDGLAIGPLTREGLAPTEPPRRYTWEPRTIPDVAVGDRLVLADFYWFSTNSGNRYLTVPKPKTDTVSAPTPECEPDSYQLNPDAHQYCCKPHEIAEAEFSDVLAERRARGELNPQKWPPIRDDDGFEVSAAGAPIGEPDAAAPEPVPDDVTIDDLE
jgi:hypothetical protein